MLGNTSTSWTVHSDSMHFIQKGDCTILISQITHGFNGGDGAAHAVDTLESNDLGLSRIK